MIKLFQGIYLIFTRMYCRLYSNFLIDKLDGSIQMVIILFNYDIES